MNQLKSKSFLSEMFHIGDKVDPFAIKKSDQFFLWFFIMHIPLATFIIPIGQGTWREGLVSSLLLNLVSGISYFFYRGELSHRILNGLILVCFSAIFISLRLGQIEQHFHILIFLPLLVFYRDWRVLIPATLLTTIHHAAFNYCQLNNITLNWFPIKIFKYDTGWDIVLIHVLYVAIGVSFLIYFAEIFRKESIKVLSMNKFLDAEVEARTKDLKTANSQLNLENQRKQQLVHVLCHDLKNPIGSAITSLEMLKIRPEKMEKFLSIIDAKLHSGIDIIELIRMMLSLEEGKIVLDLNAYQLREMVETSVKTFDELLVKKGILINVEIDESLKINCERVSFISSVINNLLTNSIKFSNPGSSIDIIGVREGDRVLIKIIDRGIGMPDSLAKLVFDPSATTTRPGTDGEKGTGFGMPLVKQFVEAYGGTITLVSREKEQFPETHGTEVTLSLMGSS